MRSAAAVGDAEAGSGESRAAGAEAARDHVVHFYDSAEYPAAHIAEQLHGALRLGAAALVLATAPHSREITAALARAGIDVDAEAMTGRLVVRDAEQVARAAVVDARPRHAAFLAMVEPLVRRAVEQHGAVQIYAEVVDVLARVGDIGSALQVEGWWNELLADAPARVICGYALSSFADAAATAGFRRVCESHARVEPSAAALREHAPHDVGRLLAELQRTAAALRNAETHRSGYEAELARSYEEAQRARALLQLLSDAVGRIAQAKLDLQQVLDAVVHEVAREGFARCCAINLRAEEATVVPLAAIHHLDPAKRAATEKAMREVPVELGRGIVGTVAQTGRAVRISSRPEIVERARAPYRKQVDEGSATSLIVVPLRSSGAIIGTLTASREHPDPPFTAEEQQLLQDLADRAALSLENALLYQRARHERERAERERQRAESASRAKDEFLAMLGHELRNPLSPILTAVQLMRLRAPDLLAKERTIIERQVNHMVRLVDDLLDVSRITRGKVVLKRTRVELASIVADAIEIASPSLEERSHALHVRVPDGLLIDGDRDRLAQVVVNLLTNAAKYTPARGTIEVTAEAADGRVALAVRDNGGGIDPQLLPRIFDLFIQGRQDSDRAEGGLGLGLPIARNLAQLHGGSLRAASDGPGKGSTFTLELPLVRGAAVAGALAATAESTPVRASGCRVLVVDDNLDAAAVLGDALQTLGHTVRLAHDGPSALQIAASFAPQVALLDIGLPVMDGHELAQRLTALLGPACPRLVAISGYGLQSDRQRSLDAGFVEHLVKPVDFERLDRLLARLASPTALERGDT